jgi:hypothetical protein
MKKGLLLVGNILAAVVLCAQQFGGNPSSVRWQQINTENARIIFPFGLEDRAQRMARVIDLFQNGYSGTIGDKKHKVDIVLHNETMISNAYVGLAPYRSEFYLTPPQHPFDLGAVEWADKLAIHEYRHIQQYNNFNKGASHFVSLLLGQQGRAAMNAMAIPDWFFEGDAVFNETQLTQQGRGALPLFMSSYHTLHNSNRTYSFMKMRNGSLRKYVPDHYDLGYLLVAYGRIKYGDSLWRNVTDDAARFTSLFYPFQNAVKRKTGVPFYRFVDSAMLYYRDQWKKEKVESPEWITPVEKNNVTDYKYPYAMENGSVVVLKNSYRKIPAFYIVHPDKREEKIATRDIALTDYFSYNNGKIVYATYKPDARWGFREFNNIKLVDIHSGEEKTIASRTKYFSPDISHDGRKILAVSVDSQIRSSIVIMDLTGQPIDSVKGEGLFFSNPKFAADDRHYYVAARNETGEMALLKYGTSEEIILPYANRLISYITVRNDTLLFTLTNKGRDEIWAIIDGKERKGPFQLASYSTGLYQGTLLPGGKLVSSAFTADGYRLVSYQPAWQRTDGTGLAPLYTPGAFNVSDHSVIADRFMRSRFAPYTVTKYRKGFQPFNFHSWRPYYEDPEFSFSIYGENVLNSFRSEVSYVYNENESSNKVGYNGILGGGYLQPIFGLSHTWHRSGRLGNNTPVTWNELLGYIGLQLPLNLSGGKQYRFLTLSGSYNMDHINWTGNAKTFLTNRPVNYLMGRVTYSGQVQKALQQIYPRWAQSLSLQYKSSVNYHAQQFLATGFLYLPGLANNHNIVLSAAYHARDTMSQYFYSNNFPFARGYTAVDFPRMWKFGVNYHLPLLYPDWGFGQLIYFLRIRTNLFYDYSIGKSLRTGVHNPFNTVGGELYFDMRTWNQLPVTLGVRYSRLLDNDFGRVNTQPNVWELIVPVNLF